MGMWSKGQEAIGDHIPIQKQNKKQKQKQQIKRSSAKYHIVNLQ